MRFTPQNGAKETAELLAIRALGFLAQDATRLEPFLSLTGLDPSRLRQAVAEPGFLAGVLDHVAQDEKLLLEFAADCGLNPAQVASARATLSGPAPDWGA